MKCNDLVLAAVQYQFPQDLVSILEDPTNRIKLRLMEIGIHFHDDRVLEVGTSWKPQIHVVEILHQGVLLVLHFGEPWIGQNLTNNQVFRLGGMWVEALAGLLPNRFEGFIVIVPQEFITSDYYGKKNFIYFE